MARRADPERIYQARRAAVFSKLTGPGVVDEIEAEHRIASWEREAEWQGLDRLSAAFWEAGDRWIVAQRWGELLRFRSVPHRYTDPDPR